MYSYYNITGQTVKALFICNSSTSVYKPQTQSAYTPFQWILIVFRVYICCIYIYSIKLTKNPQSGQKCGCTFSWIFKPKTQVWSPLITHSMGATWMIRVPERGWTSTRMQTYVYMRNWRLAMRIALKWTISEHFLLLFALYLLRFAHRYIFISNIFILYYWFFIYISNTHQLYCVCE